MNVLQFEILPPLLHIDRVLNLLLQPLLLIFVEVVESLNLRTTLVFPFIQGFQVICFIPQELSFYLRRDVQNVVIRFLVIVDSKIFKLCYFLVILFCFNYSTWGF